VKSSFCVNKSIVVLRVRHDPINKRLSVVVDIAVRNAQYAVNMLLALFVFQGI
jgi:hypothetical protein